MRARLLQALLAAAALCVVAAAPARADDIVVVVNPQVPAQAMTPDDVRAIFLGERQYWDHTRVYPVTYPDGSQVMQDFLRLGLGMSVNEYRSWWIKRIFRRAEVPPVSVVSPAEAVRAIENHPGGIGFLYANDLEGVAGLRPVLRLAARAGRVVQPRGVPYHARMASEREKRLFAQYLQAHGLKHSQQRELILDTFLEMPRHLTAEELHRQVSEVDPGIGLSTVYRSLRLFCDAGLAKQRHFIEGRSCFEQAVDANHHDHLICEGCGEIVEFECQEIEDLQVVMARKHRYTLTRHRLELFGLCPRCQAATKGSAAAKDRAAS